MAEMVGPRRCGGPVDEAGGGGERVFVNRVPGVLSEPSSQCLGNQWGNVCSVIRA